MSTPDRFDESDCSKCGLPVSVDQSPEGELVRFSDYQAMVQTLSSPVPVWSTEKPKVPGWYWYRGLPFYGEKGRGTIVEVRLLNLDNVEKLWMWQVDVRIPVMETAGEWCAAQPPQEGGAHDRG